MYLGVKPIFTHHTLRHVALVWHVRAAAYTEETTEVLVVDVGLCIGALLIWWTFMFHDQRDQGENTGSSLHCVGNGAVPHSQTKFLNNKRSRGKRTLLIAFDTPHTNLFVYSSKRSCPSWHASWQPTHTPRASSTLGLHVRHTYNGWRTHGCEWICGTFKLYLDSSAFFGVNVAVKFRSLILNFLLMFSDIFLWQ